MIRFITFFTNFIKQGLIPIALVGGLIGCETVVDIDLPQEPPRLVVNHVMRVEDFSARFIQVTQSQSVLDNTDIQPVSGARVTLEEENGCFTILTDDCTTTFEERQTLGVYSISRDVFGFPSAGRTYTLRVEKESFASIVATTRIPEPTKIQQLTYDTTHISATTASSSQANFGVNKVGITLDDPAGERNCYAIRITGQKQAEECDTTGNCVLSADKALAFYPIMKSNDPAIVNSNYALQGTNTQVYGNPILFSDDLFDGEQYTVRIDPDITFIGDSLRRELIVELRTITQEQYDYTYNKLLQQSLREIPHGEPVLVPGNIQGGYGIFAGYSVDEATIDFR